MDIVSGVICERVEYVPLPNGERTMNLYRIVNGRDCHRFPMSDELSIALFWQAHADEAGQSIQVTLELREGGRR